MDEKVRIAGLPSYSTWERGGDPTGTCNPGIIYCGYDDLVAVFGEPNFRELYT
jgi:hypothetical protein